MWQFWLDVGGTFTDCLARTPDGPLLRRKVLSSAVTKGRAAISKGEQLDDPVRSEPAQFWAGYALRILDEAGTVVAQSSVVGSEPGRLRVDPTLEECHRGHSLQRDEQGFHYELVSPEEAPILAIRLFLGLALDQPIPPCSVRLGTTRGTNALLTRRGARTALVTTRGLRDVLLIGYQNRPKLFDLAIQKPTPLFEATAEIDERIAADGSVLQVPNAEQVRSELSRLKDASIESLAICLLNSYANPRHEAFVASIAREIGFAEISVSTQVSPLMKLVPRGDTTVVDAYLNPVLRQYIERMARSLPGNDLRLMTSAGGLASSGHFTGKDSILSGPAGGVVGFSRVAEAAGFTKAIGFDMGGTSTDVARLDGRSEYEYQTQKAGVRIAAPMLAIETVAAGGGSICRYDGMKLVVGPQSAGADPGPACYGRGGPLTVTDCNLILGRLLPEHFPFPLERVAVERRLAEVAAQLSGPGNATEGVPYSALELAEGFVRIANANMAAAIRSISLAKGYDPRDYVLVAFGAAGPQHGCAVAAELGITQILIHPDAGVLSALGIGLADVVKHRAAGVYGPFQALTGELRERLVELESQARLDVVAEGVAPERIEVTRSLDLRYVGTDVALTIDEPASGDYATAFREAHQRLYGYVHEHRPLETVAARVQAAGRSQAGLRPSQAAPPQQTEPASRPRLYHSGRWVEAAVYSRKQLLPGAVAIGPAVIAEPLTTTIVDPGWQAAMLTGGELLLTPAHAHEPAPASSQAHSALDPALLEVFNNHLTAIATQMGITLRNTSLSVNVKERLDFSCAIFTAGGDLVVNAPHIPVHLGAMGQTVKRVLADNPHLAPGDVFVTNDPYRGGSHLPDVTVVTPVFDQVAGTRRVPSSLKERESANDGTRSVPATLQFFTASRAHHAEIGGITPGSMPPFSNNLAEEGVLIRNFQAVARGISRLENLRELLAAGTHPSRSALANLADITAQIAANQQGANDLRQMVERYSLPVVQAYMRHIQDAAERKMRVAIGKLPRERREFVDHLDDGTPIRVAITTSGERMTIDFTGTGPVSAGNLNANRAIVTAAVMYVMRLLIGEDIPLNQGVLAPVEIILPECILNPPERQRPEDCAAVVGGNVETSQRVVDVLLGALGLAAASQGTMNNLLFGDATFGYYETICGGSGATANADGADAVHTHMTNTRLTDPEVLEARYPVRLHEFSIRRGSGGAGQHKGGDGVIRRIEFLRPLTLSILSQRRGPYPPYGLAGGQPGALGKNTLQRVGQTFLSAESLAGLVQTEVQPGDILTIETPGGGGFGAP
jgi:5-oxoprolinase (ATP-hydrolysing)